MAHSNSSDWYATAESPRLSAITTTGTTAGTQWYQQVSPQYYEEQERQLRERMERMMLQHGVDPSMLPQQPTPPQSGEKTLKLIKKSIREITAEAVSPEAQEKVGSKVNRLKALGITKQAAILEAELSLRIRLARVKEWDYKVLPYDELKKFEKENQMTVTRDGLKVHIDKLEDYVGNTTVETEKKDMIIPDVALDFLEEAKKRQVFDEFGILWVEKVKDPLLLGLINGCKDYFLIAEWGEDIKFDDIIKEKNA